MKPSILDTAAGRLLTRRKVAKRSSTLATDRGRIKRHIKSVGWRLPSWTARILSGLCTPSRRGGDRRQNQDDEAARTGAGARRQGHRHRTVAIRIDQLKEIFIDATLEPVETANWFPKVIRKDYTIAINGTESGVDDPDQQFYENSYAGRYATTPAIAVRKSTG